MCQLNEQNVSVERDNVSAECRSCAVFDKDYPVLSTGQSVTRRDSRYSFDMLQSFQNGCSAYEVLDNTSVECVNQTSDLFAHISRLIMKLVKINAALSLLKYKL